VRRDESGLRLSAPEAFGGLEVPPQASQLARNARSVSARIERLRLSYGGDSQQDARRAVLLAMWDMVNDLLLAIVNPADCDEGCRELVRELGGGVASLLDGDFGAFFGTLLGSPWLMQQLDDLDARIVHVVTMAADVATATTPEGVSGALDRFAVGPGSWEHKHERGGISLTGWAGAHPALELGLSDQLTHGLALGPMLSIGFDLYAAHEHVRYGLYVPIIDVGNVANVRLANFGGDTLLAADTLPVVDWGQLFAPGAYFFVSLGRTPFVLGVGGSYVPDLRRAEPQPTGVEVRSSVLRLGLVLAVDVTILPLIDL
jgi:hypothetical protein